MSKPVINNPAELSYLKGWSYHHQLGALDTYAPHVLPSKESFPAGVSTIREQEITRAGFQPTKDHAASYLYRANPGTSWIKDGIEGAPPIAPHWVTGLSAQPEFPSMLKPRKFDSPKASELNPIESLTTYFYNRDVSVGVLRGNKVMPYFFRNADGDDLFFVHQGNGILETELGVLGYEQGHFLWIPKGIAYRFVPQSKDHHLLHMENYGESFAKPDAGFTGDAAVFYHRNIEVPKSHFVNEPGEFEIITKAHGQFTRFTHSHHPMDVVGWDGTLFPFRLHIRDINPITSWRAHIPPSAYCLFCGIGFEFCAFVPRPVESEKNSLPVPFDHINADRDEVIFYSEGVFFSKDSSAEGTMTFHPRGFSHGPHHGSLERATKKREEQGIYFFDGYFLMVETFRPLLPTKFSQNFEDADYINSWLS